MANQRAYYFHSAHGVQAARLTQGRRRQQSPNVTKPRREKHNADGKRDIWIDARASTKVSKDEKTGSYGDFYEEGKEEAKE